MTDTGQVPGEGQPEHSGAQQEVPDYSASSVPAGVEQSGYAFHDHGAVAPGGEDQLLMPGAQGAWSEQQAAYPVSAGYGGQGVYQQEAGYPAHDAGYAHDAAYLQDTDYPQEAMPGAAVPGGQEQAYVPTEQFGAQEQAYVPAEQFGAQEQAYVPTEQFGVQEQAYVPAEQFGAQEQPYVPEQSGGAEQAYLPEQQQPFAEESAPPTVPEQAEGPEQPVVPEQADVSEQADVPEQAVSPEQPPQTAQPVAQVPPARRPLHMGPPVPESTGGVVRSLSDRGPAHPTPPPGRQAGPPTLGPEYLDVQQASHSPYPHEVLEVSDSQPGAVPEQPVAWAPDMIQQPRAEAGPVAPAAEPAPAADQVAEAGSVPADASAPPAEQPLTGDEPAGPTPDQGEELPADPAAPSADAAGPQPEPQPETAAMLPDEVPDPNRVEVVAVPEQHLAPADPVDESQAPVAAEGAAESESAESEAEDGAAVDEAAPEPAPVPEAASDSGPEPVNSGSQPLGAVADESEPSASTAEAAQEQDTPVAEQPAPDEQHETEAEADAQGESEAGTEEEAEPASGAEFADDSAGDGNEAQEDGPEIPADAAAEPAATEPESASEPGAAESGAAEETAGSGPAEETAEPVAAEAEAVEPGAVEEAAEPGEEDTPPARALGYGDAEREAVMRVIRERRDIRNGFRPDPIPHDVLLRVLEAAHTAPSVGHSQPWDFVVIRSAETRRSMHELAARQREAYAKSLPKGRAKQFKALKVEAILETPVNIVVTADPTRGGRHTLGRHTQPQMAPYSSALAVENLWLAARAEGLGVGWVSFFDEREMVRELGLPEHLEVVAYLCVGYVDEFPDEPELTQSGWSKRRPLSWVVHEETYGRRALPGEDPHDLLAETLQGIRPLDAKALGEAWERQKRMTKPAGALGMLEIISAQLCGLSRKCPPPVPEPAAVAVFAGDHGVHAQGVTPWPQEVTAQMVANFLDGGAVCNAFASQVGAEVCVVDVGVASELPGRTGLLPRKVRPGTADFTEGPALSREEVLRAVEVGIETARDLVAAGNKALVTGEMGIANTTVSAALISVYTGMDPAEVTGRGTGINDETHARKVDVVRKALELHEPDPADPIGVLAAVGGLEHAALVGLLLGGASLRTPVILDGVSAGAAALVARAIAPEALAACIAGHRSAEPGHVAALTKLGLRPLIDLDLRLGEGTGALLALPIVQSAARAMHEVATFDAAGVTEKA